MDDTTRQKVEESPEERKRRIRRQRMIQDGAADAGEKH